MSLSSDPSPTPVRDPAQSDPRRYQLPPSNWREALMALIASRLMLIQLESKDVAGAALRKAIWFGSAAISVVITWALLLVSAISLVAEFGNWPWNRVALAAALIHLLAASVFIRLAKSNSASAFPITRAEFQKDREWIENLQHPKKSND